MSEKRLDTICSTNYMCRSRLQSSTNVGSALSIQLMRELPDWLMNYIRRIDAQLTVCIENARFGRSEGARDDSVEKANADSPQVMDSGADYVYIR
jgi:hypothetical protein